MGLACCGIHQRSQRVYSNDEDNIVEILKAVPKISTLTQMELEELASRLERKCFLKDEYMMKVDEVGIEFYIIISGVCKVLDREGKQVAELGSGDFVGEMALIEKKPRNASVKCVENCETLVADKYLFESVLGEHSTVRFGKRHAGSTVLTMRKDEEEEKEDVVGRIDKSNAEVQWIYDCVRSNILFANLENQSRLKIIKMMYLEDVPENYDLIKQNALKGDTFYVIREGSFAVIIDRTRVAKLVKGQCFGELALMQDAPRAASIRAIEKSQVWTLQRSFFQDEFAIAKQKMHQQRLEWLKDVELFRSISSRQLSMIGEALEMMIYSKGQVIIREGAVGDRFYVVKSGYVRWETSNGETGERREGEYFGERALIKNLTRAATVTATTQSVCLELKKQDFQDLLSSEYETMKNKIIVETAATQEFLRKISLAQNRRSRYSSSQATSSRFEDLESVGMLPRGRVIFLGSTYNSSLKQEHSQRSCRRILDSVKIDYDDIDGAKPEHKDLRNRLWDVSKKRGVYPQVFVEDGQGIITYIGDYDVIEHLNEFKGKGVALLETFGNYINLGEGWQTDSGEEIYSMS